PDDQSRHTRANPHRPGLGGRGRGAGPPSHGDRGRNGLPEPPRRRPHRPRARALRRGSDRRGDLGARDSSPSSRAEGKRSRRRAHGGTPRPVSGRLERVTQVGHDTLIGTGGPNRECAPFTVLRIRSRNAYVPVPASGVNEVPRVEVACRNGDQRRSPGRLICTSSTMPAGSVSSAQVTPNWVETDPDDGATSIGTTTLPPLFGNPTSAVRISAERSNVYR